MGVYAGSPTSMVKHAASGETRGVTYELGAVQRAAERAGLRGSVAPGTQ